MRKTLKKPAPKKGGKTLSKPKHVVRSSSLSSKEKKMTKTLSKSVEKPSTGPIPVFPTGWRPKGKKTTFAGERCVFVKPEDMPRSYPRPHKSVPPNTFWRVNVKDHEKGLCLVTIMPDGVNLAWNECALCHNTARRCVCEPGFLSSRGIEYIYIRTLASSEGENFDTPVDVTQYGVTSRALHWYLPKRGQQQPVGHVIRTKSRPAPERPAEGRSRPARKALHKPQPAQQRRTLAKPEFDASNVDLAKVNRDTEKKAADLEAEVMKRLSAPQTKRLRK